MTKMRIIFLFHAFLLSPESKYLAFHKSIDEDNRSHAPFLKMVEFTESDKNELSATSDFMLLGGLPEL